MKQFQIAIIATIITCVILISCACAMPAYAEGETAELGHGEFYPKLAIVVEKEWAGDSNMWVITCEDRTGNLWAFYDDEGAWDVGDIANLLMWDISESTEEYEVIEVYWEGYTENIAQWMRIQGWR